MAETTQIFEMETELANDSNGAYRDSVCEELETEIANCKRWLDTGLNPEEFRVAENYLKSLQAAYTTVQRIWLLTHQKLATLY